MKALISFIPTAAISWISFCSRYSQELPRNDPIRLEGARAFFLGVEVVEIVRLQAEVS